MSTDFRPHQPSGHYPQPTSFPPAKLDKESAAREVVVVGAGPVGLATALGLARRGVQVTVVEAAVGVSHGSRAICFSRHSLEILDRLGVGPAMSKLSLPWVGGRSFYRRQEVLSFQMPASDYDVRPPMVNISQGVVEELLVDAAYSHDEIEILWGVRAVGLESGADGVSLELQTADGPRTIQASWVIAADGARSEIRRVLGLTMRGTSYEGRYVIADIHLPADLPAERRVWFDPDSAPGSTIIMHRQPDDIWRVDYQLQPDEDAEYEMTPERIQKRISGHLSWLGVDTDWALEWSSLYRAHSLSLDDYVFDRVLFAGDAAHLVPIFGVRGLNSGLEDADTLSWQLAAVVHGTAESSLLGAYSAERRDAWAQNIWNAEKSTRIMSPQGRGDMMTRNALLALAVHERDYRPLVDPRQSTATHVRDSPLTWQQLGEEGDGVTPGDPLTDQLVEVKTAVGIKSSTLLTELGHGFAVVGIDLEQRELAGIQRQLATALAPEPVRAVVISKEPGAAEGTVKMKDDQFVFGQRGDVVVVRPDGLVLSRVSRLERDRLDALGATLRRGEAPSAHPKTTSSEPAVFSMEDVWRSLSETLDEVDDPAALLTRLVLVLSRQSTQARWLEALELSRVTRPPERRETMGTQ